LCLPIFCCRNIALIEHHCGQTPFGYRAPGVGIAFSQRARHLVAGGRAVNECRHWPLAQSTWSGRHTPSRRSAGVRALVSSTSATQNHQTIGRSSAILVVKFMRLDFIWSLSQFDSSIYVCNMEGNHLRTWTTTFYLQNRPRKWQSPCVVFYRFLCKDNFASATR
jgi:hypothetical protein